MTKSSAAAGHNSGNLFARLGPIVYRATSDLKPYGNNPRKRVKQQDAALAASLAEFGFNVPILVSPDLEIVAGEARWRTATELGLPEVPVIMLAHLSAAQVRAFRIADNKIGSLGAFDETKLAVEFQAIIDEGEVAIDLTGFETAQVDMLLFDRPGSMAGVAADADDQAFALTPALSCQGDLWALERHRLICGSSRDPATWERLMGDDLAAMIFTDPPYNVPVANHVSSTGRHREFAEASGEMSRPEFAEFLTSAIACPAGYVKDGGVIDVCMDYRGLPELFAAAERNQLSTLNMCVWNKTNGGMGSLYRSKHELVLVLKKGKASHTNNVQLVKHVRGGRSSHDR